MPMLHCQLPARKAVMSLRAMTAFAAAVTVSAITLDGAAVSRQQADAFAIKIDAIEKHAERAGAKPRGTTAAPRRTPVTESEINSWFTYHAAEVLPDGLTQPSLTIGLNGRVSGTATVDLDAIRRSRASGNTFDIWNLLGGRVPVTVAGVVRTRAGRARFELEEASIRGFAVPRLVVQELVAYYSRTPDHPAGHRLDEEFELPASIDRIETSPGSAVVVQ